MTEPVAARVADVESLLQSAQAQAEAGQLDAARLLFLQAVSRDDSGRARNEWGCFLWRTGALREAETQFRLLFKFAHQTGSKLLQSVAQNNLAAVARESGRASLAASWQQVAQGLSASASSTAPDTPETCREQLGADLGNRANDAITAGDYALAERLLMASLRWERESGSVSGQAADWGSLGVVSALQGRLQQAAQRFCQALKLHRRAGDWGGSGCDLLNLAEVCCDLKRWLSAERLARHAVRMFARAGHRTWQLKAERLYRRLRRQRLLPTFDPSRN